MTGIGYELQSWEIPKAVEEAEFILGLLMTFEVCQQMCINQTYSIEMPTGEYIDAHNASVDEPSTCTGTADAPPCVYASGTDGCPEGCNDDGSTCSGTADAPICDLDAATDQTADCPDGCTFTDSYTPWVNRSEIMHEQIVPCIGIEFFPKWASAIWNASTRMYDIKQSAIEDGPVQAEEAEMIVEIGSCGYYHVKSTPAVTFDYSTNTNDDPLQLAPEPVRCRRLLEPDCRWAEYSTGSFFLAGSPGTGTFQPAPWTYVLGNDTYIDPTDNSTVHGPFGGVGNYTVFEDDQEIEIEEGQVYLLGWNLLEGHGTSRNSFLQFSNGSCSPSFTDRIKLFDTSITLDSPAPGYSVSEMLYDGTEVTDTSYQLPDAEHIGAAYVTAPLSGKFRPTAVRTHTTNKEFTGCTDPGAVNYNEHAFVDVAVEDCKYNCTFTWTPTDYDVTYSAEKALASSYLPHDILRGDPARGALAAFDGDMATSYHSNQGNPSEDNPVELQYDFVELADNQAIVQYAFSSRCCDNPLAGPDAPKSWTVQGSHDGTNWFELASEQDDTVWGSETRIYVIDSPLNCRYIKLAVTDVGGREAIMREGGLYNFLVLSEVQFFVGEYLCTAAPNMLGYDVSACATAVIDEPKLDRNPCAKTTGFLFTKDRVVSKQGTALGLALNYYEVVPCYHPDAVVCNTEQVFVPVGPPSNCSLNTVEVPASCVDEGTVCASGTTGACPAGCTDDDTDCSGTATCELGAGGEEADCPTTDGCTYTPRREEVDYGMDGYKGLAHTSNVSACNETERMVLSRFWSTLQPTDWANTECPRSASVVGDDRAIGGRGGVER